MSDQQDKNIEQVAQETAAAGEDVGEPVERAGEDLAESAARETPIPVVPVAPAAQPASEGRKGSAGVAWLALLLVIALGAAAGWWLREQQGREARLQERLQQLESATGADQSALDALGQRWQGQLEAGLEQIEAELGGLAGATQRLDQALQGETGRLQQALQALAAEQAEQRAEIARYSANDRQAWLLAEAEYLLRLANQRLIMAGDVKSAAALLASADQVLRELDDAGLYRARSAVAADLAALKAVPGIDIEGIYLRLSALVGQADKLVIFELPQGEQQPRAVAADSWQERLRRGYEAALEKLSSYVIIRRRDAPMTALMDPQWEGLVRQNLRMLLEQAQVALLSQNQSLYTQSLQRAQYWVGEFFESDEAAARSMSREITQLEAEQIAVSLPDISGSLRALNDAIKQRLQQGGGE